MKGLNIQNPHAYFIVNALKDREHRTWSTKYRGRFLVVSSLKPDKKFMEEYGFKKEAFKYGFILGSVELYDVKDYGNGVFAFLLRQPLRYLTPLPQKGRLGFFNQFKIIFIESEKKVEFKKFERLSF